MMALELNLRGPVVAKQIVSYTRKPYRPDAFPFTFPEERHLAQIWLREGETVEDVMGYHYGTNIHSLALVLPIPDEESASQ